MSITKKQMVAWQKADADLKAAKETELELRSNICLEILGDKLKGVEHLKAFGFDAAATAKLNQKIDIDVLKSIFKSLSSEEKACIRYKPELIAKEYKNLPAKSILHSAVESKPGTPSLTIKPIKD